MAISGFQTFCLNDFAFINISIMECKVISATHLQDLRIIYIICRRWVIA